MATLVTILVTAILGGYMVAWLIETNARMATIPALEHTPCYAVRVYCENGTWRDMYITSDYADAQKRFTMYSAVFITDLDIRYR